MILEYKVAKYIKENCKDDLVDGMIVMSQYNFINMLINLLKYLVCEEQREAKNEQRLD